MDKGIVSNFGSMFDHFGMKNKDYKCYLVDKYPKDKLRWFHTYYYSKLLVEYIFEGMVYKDFLNYSILMGNC